MSLHFRYRLFAMQTPSVILGGRWARPRPVIPITVFGPGQRSWSDLATLDTGADETLFPADVALDIGLDLSQAPRGNISGVGAGVLSVRYAQVTISLTDGNETREWATWVGFTLAPLKRPLLGFAGFLQFFTAAFHGDREEVSLDVNALYPGT